MAIDNLQSIIPFMQFDDPNDFYYLQILQRKKENPQLGSNSRVIKNYYINSVDYLEKHYGEIKELCNRNLTILRNAQQENQNLIHNEPEDVHTNQNQVQPMEIDQQVQNQDFNQNASKVDVILQKLDPRLQHKPILSYMPFQHIHLVLRCIRLDLPMTLQPFYVFGTLLHQCIVSYELLPNSAILISSLNF